MTGHVVQFPQADRIAMADELQAIRPDWRHDAIMAAIRACHPHAITYAKINRVALQCAAEPDTTPADIADQWQRWEAQLFMPQPVMPSRDSRPLWDDPDPPGRPPVTSPDQQRARLDALRNGGDPVNPATPEQIAAHHAEASAILAAARTRRLAEQAAKDAEREAEREARRRQA